MKTTRTCLLIGNTRWHFAEQNAHGWRFSHLLPSEANSWALRNDSLVAWASVGRLPDSLFLDPHLRLDLQDVPFNAAPSWLGIDRAFGVWGALLRSVRDGIAEQEMLVADAGTVLSITRVNSRGEFAGGQLVPGLRLQLSAMGNGTENLHDPGIEPIPLDLFPSGTAEAMRRGCLQSLIGTLIEAQREVDLPLWLCGGDAPALLEGLSERGVKAIHCPNLVLEGMVDIYARIKRGPDQ